MRLCMMSQAIRPLAGYFISVNAPQPFEETEIQESTRARRVRDYVIQCETFPGPRHPQTMDEVLQSDIFSVQGPYAESQHNRRQFLKTLTVGGSAVGLTLLFPMSGLRAAGQTKALLLSCMDFRLVDDTARYMASRGLTDKYDHIIGLGDKYTQRNVQHLREDSMYVIEPALIFSAVELVHHGTPMYGGLGTFWRGALGVMRTLVAVMNHHRLVALIISWVLSRFWPAPADLREA